MSISKLAVVNNPNLILMDSIVEPFCIIESDTRIDFDAHIRSHTVIYSGNIIGRHFRTGNKVNIRENNQIGNNVSIGSLSNIEHNIIIEDGVRIHSQVFIPELTILKEKCWIGPNVVITNAKYPVCKNSKDKLEGVTVGEKAIIGANVTILPGVTLGRNCIIGAGSVVTKDVEEDAIMIGNPAVIIGWKPIDYD